MDNHRFGSITGPADNTRLQYRQCQACGAVMFIEGDDYFNMICPKSSERVQRENLRK